MNACFLCRSPGTCCLESDDFKKKFSWPARHWLSLRQYYYRAAPPKEYDDKIFAFIFMMSEADYLISAALGFHFGDIALMMIGRVFNLIDGILFFYFLPKNGASISCVYSASPYAYSILSAYAGLADVLQCLATCPRRHAQPRAFRCFRNKAAPLRAFHYALALDEMMRYFGYGPGDIA